MRTLLVFLVWCILFVLCWPLALVMIFLFPLVWLITLPFRLVGLTIDLTFSIIGQILMFPFKLMRRS